MSKDDPTVVVGEIVVFDEAQAWWDENPERRSLLDLRINGSSITFAQKNITEKRRKLDPSAAEISRVTLYEWEKNPHYRSLMASQIRDHQESLLQRRQRETNGLNDRVAGMATRLAKDMADSETRNKGLKIEDLGKLERLTSMYTRLRAEERVDMGLDGKTVTHKVGIVGRFDHHIEGESSKPDNGFSDFGKLLSAHAPKLDLSMTDTNDPEEALGDMAAQMITESGLLDDDDKKDGA